MRRMATRERELAGDRSLDAAYESGVCFEVFPDSVALQSRLQAGVRIRPRLIENWSNSLFRHACSDKPPSPFTFGARQ